MLSKDLLVTGLNITEDFYEFKGTFELSGPEHMDLDISQLTDDTLEKIKKTYELPDSIDEIRKALMEKLTEAAGQESRFEEGQKAL